MRESGIVTHRIDVDVISRLEGHGARRDVVRGRCSRGNPMQEEGEHRGRSHDALQKLED